MMQFGCPLLLLHDGGMLLLLLLKTLLIETDGNVYMNVGKNDAARLFASATMTDYVLWYHIMVVGLKLLKKVLYS